MLGNLGMTLGRATESSTGLITGCRRLCCICFLLFLQIGKRLGRRPVSGWGILRKSTQAYFLRRKNPRSAMVERPNDRLTRMCLIFLRRTNYRLKPFLNAEEL